VTCLACCRSLHHHHLCSRHHHLYFLDSLLFDLICRIRLCHHHCVCRPCCLCSCRFGSSFSSSHHQFGLSLCHLHDLVGHIHLDQSLCCFCHLDHGHRDLLYIHHRFLPHNCYRSLNCGFRRLCCLGSRRLCPCWVFFLECWCSPWLLKISESWFGCKSRFT
jgi:hypothetical protein